MRKTYANCHNLGNIPDNINKILLTKTKDKKSFKTCVVCGPDHRAYGYCISCMELLCAECVRAHKQVGMTSKHNIAEVKQYLHPENNESKCDVVVCDYCGPQTSAVVHCSDCYEFLCEYCLKDHKRVKLTSNHRLIDIQQLSTPSETSRKFICESHNEIGLCTCDTCEATVLCHQCLPAHHEHLLRKPHNFEVYLPSFITCFRKRDKKIDRVVKDVLWRKQIAKSSLKIDLQCMRNNVYSERKATKEQKQYYLRKLEEIRKRQTELVEGREREILSCKEKSAELLNNWEQCKDGDCAQQEQLYNILLKVHLEPIPNTADLNSNEEHIFTEEFTQSLPLKPSRRFRAPPSDSEEDEEDDEKDELEEEVDFGLKYYDSKSDLTLTKEQIQNKYCDIFEDHKTKSWKQILKEAEDMLLGNSDYHEAMRKAWSSMALVIRKAFAKFGISILSPRAIKTIIEMLFKNHIHYTTPLESLQKYYLTGENDYYYNIPTSDICKEIVKYITYMDEYKLDNDKFHNFIKIQYTFSTLNFQEVDEHVVCLDNVNYNCCFELY